MTPPSPARLKLLVILAGLLAASAARAGPPYVTDDPEPTDFHRWEVYGFAAAAHVPGETEGVTGLDLNYGGARDLQLTATLPLAYRHAGGAHWSLGDIELAAKLKLLHQDGAGLDVAVFPRLFLPTGEGSHRAGLLLPVWAQRDIGAWSVFGGGGYTLNPGADARNFWQGGLAVTRQASERLNLGVEIYGHGPDAPGARRYLGMNLGAAWRLTDHWSLIGAAGPGLDNTRDGGRYSAYAALKADF